MCQQARIFGHLSKSIINFLHGDLSLEEILLDLEANLGVIEDSRLKDSVLNASNEIDDCINIYTVPVGEKRARKVLKQLLSEITSA